MWNKLKELIKNTAKHFQMANVSDSSVVLAFYALLSILPMLLVIGSILPYFNISANHIMSYVKPVMPPAVYQTLEPIIDSFLSSESSGALSIGILVTLWSASRAIAAFQRTVNLAYGIKKPNAIINRIVSFVWTLLLVVFLFSIMIFFSFGQLALEGLRKFIEIPDVITATFANIKWPLTLIGVFVLTLLLYYFVPTAKLKWRYVWPGAILTTVGWLLLSQLFTIYLRYFASGITGYKTIGTFIILMFWLNYLGEILLVGAVLNSAVQELMQGDIEEQDYIAKFINQTRTRTVNFRNNRRKQAPVPTKKKPVQPKQVKRTPITKPQKRL
ncbi:YihY/virulence factor BrkB family protein [Secundilactobacillus oryzae]|uniref:YihY/virulence factor BrkB family protein n=1 Tax=Secundilactobacillus oryzae TaxID=1202668 RepID=UPI000553D193|nr:YihY/virulence factor BrkB family protein [Secundilactobacillus oryzae]